MKTAFVYNIVQRWIFVFAVFVLILMNFLSNSIPFGGKTNAMISAEYPTLITPAGYAFSIWGVIYTALVVFAIFQLLKGKTKRFYKMIWPYFMINVIANISWLLAFQNELFFLSVVIMFVLLGSLIGMFRFFYRLKRAMGTTHRFFFQIPFSLYFGWVSVAAIVNVAVLLVSLDISLFSSAPEVWAAIMISIAGVLATGILLLKKDFIFPMATVWALAAIWVKQSELALVANTAGVVAIAIALAIVLEFVRDRIKIGKYGKARPSLKGS